MGYLIDTNIISELAKPRPNINALNWAEAISLVNLSVVTVEELQFGLSWRPNTKVQVWLDNFQEDYCVTLPVTTEIARLAGEWRGVACFNPEVSKGLKPICLLQPQQHCMD